MHFKYSKIVITLIALVLSTAIFISINKFAISYSEKVQNTQNTQIISKPIENQNIQIPSKESQEEYEERLWQEKWLEKLFEMYEDENSWNIKIDEIDLNASIRDGTTEEILENAVGHFEETSKWDGNIGLAAHNRGYTNNYFQNLKNLEKGDNIEYCYNGKTRNYQVESMQYIQNTDWTYLLRDKQNKLTLITCVEDKPEYRLCVQAVEI